MTDSPGPEPSRAKPSSTEDAEVLRAEDEGDEL